MTRFWRNLTKKVSFEYVTVNIIKNLLVLGNFWALFQGSRFCPDPHLEKKADPDPKHWNKDDTNLVYNLMTGIRQKLYAENNNIFCYNCLQVSQFLCRVFFFLRINVLFLLELCSISQGFGAGAVPKQAGSKTLVFLRLLLTVLFSNRLFHPNLLSFLLTNAISDYQYLSPTCLLKHHLE